MTSWTQMYLYTYTFIYMLIATSATIIAPRETLYLTKYVWVVVLYLGISVKVWRMFSIFSLVTTLYDQIYVKVYFLSPAWENNSPCVPVKLQVCSSSRLIFASKTIARSRARKYVCRIDGQTLRPSLFFFFFEAFLMCWWLLYRLSMTVKATKGKGKTASKLF